MKLTKYLYLLCIGAMFSCTDLDIPPKHIVGEPIIFETTDGIMSYISRMYSTIPMEDFNYNFEKSGLFNKSDVKYKQQSCLTGEAIGRDTKGAEVENVSYWDNAFLYVRDANLFIETLPKYASFHTPENVKTYTAEAYFVRAFIYYSLVKRYGGVPIIDKVMDYPATVTMEGAKLYRDSEEATWDFIGSDLDYAIENLPNQNQKGRVNKYAAAAFKSRVMLHAGSIAKYNNVNEIYNNVRICGIPASRANEYFIAAYEASKIVDKANKYKLYKGDWIADNKAAQTENFTNIFLKDTEENIFVRYFQDLTAMHDYDNSAQPRQTSSGNNDSELCPTLDFVEMFEGFDKDANGKFESFSADGNYKLYSSPVDAFADCEPRLSGTVILPMSKFRGEVIELRRGIWTGLAGNGIKPLLDPGYIGNYNSKYGEESMLKMSNNFGFNDESKNFVKLKDNTTMKRTGASGVLSEWDYGCISGFYTRKYLNPNQTDNAGSKSTQSWIEIRYAEVLLNRAEAASELIEAGVTTSKDGESYRQEAFNNINLIRERAGATQLTGEADLNIDIVRLERRKELAFEQKTYWDLKRWRVIYEEQNNRRYRTLNAFYSVDAEKYFLDVKVHEPRGGVTYIYNFDTRNYYQQIPNGEITKNPNCKQNPGY